MEQGGLCDMERRGKAEWVASKKVRRELQRY
jgi:hypothetical protein